MTYYKSGSWNVICQVCGGKYKADEVRKRWDGLIVCDADYENRHIMDFLKVREDDPIVPYVSSEPADQFIAVSCPFPQGVGMADIGTADCSIANFSITFPHNRTMPIASMAIAGCTYPAQNNPYD